MSKQLIDNVKFGAFVLAGLLFLVLLLYMIGKNENLFGATYVLKSRFDNVLGLVPGNNVRYAGIEAGSVKEINILDDTVIEVTMNIKKKMRNIIRKNAVVSIGTDGLVGNKVVNIVSARQAAPLAAEGDILASKRMVPADEMLLTLNSTNNDIAVIAANLKTTVHRINTSDGLWTILHDQSIANDLRFSVANLRLATGKAGKMVSDLQAIVADVKDGKGSLGTILRDTSLGRNLEEAGLKIRAVGENADSLIYIINGFVAGLQEDANTGRGTLNALLKDTAIVIKLNSTLDNLQKGTDGFNQNMEALKHNFLLRGYFRKKEKQRLEEVSGSKGENN